MSWGVIGGGRQESAGDIRDPVNERYRDVLPVTTFLERWVCHVESTDINMPSPDTGQIMDIEWVGPWKVLCGFAFSRYYVSCFRRPLLPSKR